MLRGAFFVIVFWIVCVMSATASPPKRTHYDDSSLDSTDLLEAIDSPRPQPEAIVDPMARARELACEPLIIRSFVQAWKATLDGTRGNGLAETGFAIESYKSSISVQGWTEATLNRLSIPEDEFTVAVAHVHGRGADEHPAANDMRSPVPNFVISKTALYVTAPGTMRIVRVRGGLDDADGWNKRCMDRGVSPALQR